MTALHTTEQLYEKAEELLTAAEHEQERAEEDVVTHLICNHARMSISHFLIGYLLQKNVPILPPASIASLQQQCQAIDPRFDWMDMDMMPCRYEAYGKQYCIERDIVDQCLKAAQQVRSIVQAEIPGY